MGLPEMEEEMSSDDLLSAINKLSERVSTLEGEKSALETELESVKNQAAKATENLGAVKAELAAVKSNPRPFRLRKKSTRVIMSGEKGKAF